LRTQIWAFSHANGFSFFFFLSFFFQKINGVIWFWGLVGGCSVITYANVFAFSWPKVIGAKKKKEKKKE
jgi:hypothetical protein